MKFYREPKVIFSSLSETEKSESLPIKRMVPKKKLLVLEKLHISVKLLLSRFVTISFQFIYTTVLIQVQNSIFCRLKRQVPYFLY